MILFGFWESDSHLTLLKLLDDIFWKKFLSINHIVQFVLQAEKFHIEEKQSTVEFVSDLQIITNHRFI